MRWDFRAGFENLDDFYSMLFLEQAELGKLVRTYNSTRIPSVQTFGLGDVENYRHNQSVPKGDPSRKAMSAIAEYVQAVGFQIWDHDALGPSHFIMFDDKNMPVQIANLVWAGTVLGDISLHQCSFTGAKEHALAINELWNTYAVPIPEADQKAHILIDFKDTQQGPQANIQEQILDDTMDYSLAEFYPWVKMDLATYFQEFLNSKANVLVMIGPPGTGKSTFIRTMLRRLKVESLISYKTKTIVHPEFITFCSQFLKNGFMANFGYAGGMPTTKTNRVVVVEDGDELMAKRSDGNHIMSEILNLTNGIVSSDANKFIFSTNLDEISDIDPALLRPGRCFDVLCFRTLNATEANAVRKAAKLPERDFDPKRSYKLAEVLNDSVTENRVETTVKPRFGFA